MALSSSLQTPGVGKIADPEVRLSVAYAPANVRPALIALWNLDAQLANILRTTTDPMIGQMRLTWWHDALGKPGGVAGEPVLMALARTEISPAIIQQVVEGWEALLDGEDDAALAAFGKKRGGGLFSAAAMLIGADDPVIAAGAGWALVDLARHHSRADVTKRALALASARLTTAPTRWSKPARPLGMLAKLARRDLNGLEQQGAPRRVVGMAVLALTGR